jgi:hypothetical protein
MYQTAYTGILSGINKGKDTMGGFCTWYFTPVENIDTWPAINPLTQKAVSKPVLKNGAYWYRSNINRQSSFDEVQKLNAAGHFYEWKFNTQTAGHFPIIMGNLAYRRFIIIAVARSVPNHWLLIGTQHSPLKFESGFDGGKHWVENALTKILFTGDCRHKALLIPFTQEEIDNGHKITPSILGTENGFTITTEDGIDITI